MADRIKVLIVDGSAVARGALTEIFSADPDLAVIAAVPDPYIAVDCIAREVPDVITIDIKLPRMDGLTFLRKIMAQHPIPVVVISSTGGPETESSWRIIEAGAVDVLAKPPFGRMQIGKELGERLCAAVKKASRAKVQKVRRFDNVPPKLSADVILEKVGPLPQSIMTDTVIAVGASTGGTEALRIFLEMMPVDCPGIVIVQHMPENFTRAFAERLDMLCPISVKEAESGDAVVRGRALIAPGNMHLLLQRSGKKYSVETRGGPPVSRHRPSVDVLFRSVTQSAGKNAIGVIMTGMGDDGARGMREMSDAGAYTIAQDEESCVVFGMPAEAIKYGGVSVVAPLQNIASIILNRVWQER
jgi:two-component system, chemotaxis family, protein-glutamate methylesterase/glutaminase